MGAVELALAILRVWTPPGGASRFCLGHGPPVDILDVDLNLACMSSYVCVHDILPLAIQRVVLSIPTIQTIQKIQKIDG